jgi:UDP-N-acetylglucosamine enolpyruvyl transferase
MDDDVFHVRQSRLRAAGRITTSLWPGFPSDLVSLVTVLATQRKGRRSYTIGCTNCACSRSSS